MQFISFLETLAIHYTLCFNVRNVGQGGRSKQMMISSRGVISNPYDKVWGDYEVLLFKFSMCMCVYVARGKNVYPCDWEH